MSALTDDQYARLVEVMKHLAPPRNINAIHALFSRLGDPLLSMFNAILKAVVDGFQQKQAQQIMILMMAAFDAGRIYQTANPEAPRDLAGYG